MNADPEVVEALEGLGLSVDDAGTVEVFHATTEDGARAITNEGTLRADTYGHVYLTSSPRIVDVFNRDVDAVVRLRVAVSDLFVSKDWRPHVDRVDLVVQAKAGVDYSPAEVVGWEPIERT